MPYITPKQLPKYPSTLANSTLFLLFSEILKFSKIISSKSKNIVKENSEYFAIFHLSKLSHYSMDMCWNGQGTMIILK
jgi:hypothetical protein